MTRKELADWLVELGNFWRGKSGDPKLPEGVHPWDAVFQAAEQLRIPPDPIYIVRHSAAPSERKEGQ